MHKKTASRKVSRLAQRVKAMSRMTLVVNDGRQFFSPLHIRHGKERARFAGPLFFERR